MGFFFCIEDVVFVEVFEVVCDEMFVVEFCFV